VAAPIKSWPLSFKQRGEKGREDNLYIGIFECPECKTRFRSAVRFKPKTKEKASIKNMVERIKIIQGELMQTLKTLREKIGTLETERSNLMLEIEELKKVAESRAAALESEVSMLREEVRSLREILGYSE
jgi:chromosome segregation ATPase